MAEACNWFKLKLIPELHSGNSHLHFFVGNPVDQWPIDYVVFAASQSAIGWLSFLD